MKKRWLCMTKIAEIIFISSQKVLKFFLTTILNDTYHNAPHFYGVWSVVKIFWRWKSMGEFKLEVVDTRFGKNNPYFVPDRGTRIAEAQLFLEKLYKNPLYFGNYLLHEYGCLWLEQNGEKITMSFDVTQSAQRQAMAITEIQKSDEGYNVFFGVSLTNKPFPENRRAGVKDINLQLGIWIDIDVQGGTHIGEKYPPSRELAMSFLPLKPSIVVNSGYGIHAYYLFSKVLVIGEHNRNEATERNRKFIEIVRNNAGVYKEAVESVQDLSRILRMPGTFNYKLEDDNPPICCVIQDNAVKYNLAELDEFIDANYKSIPEPAEKIISSATKVSSKNFMSPNLLTEQQPRKNLKEVTRKDLIQIIKTVPFEIFFPERDRHEGWVCPKCDSGKGVHGTGISKTPHGNKYTCWKCHKTGDVIDWLKYGHNFYFNEALQYGAKILGLKLQRNKVEIDGSTFAIMKGLDKHDSK